MGYFDPAVGMLFALIAGGLISFGLYSKRQIRRLDRIIAEKEAAMNAGATPPSTAS